MFKINLKNISQVRKREYFVNKRTEWQPEDCVLKSPGQPQCNACVCLRFCYVCVASKMAAIIDKSNGKT